MAKFNVEVELDWLYEESVDEALKEQVISGIQNKLTENIQAEATSQISDKITEHVEEAVDKFLEKVTAEKLEEVKIPYKRSSWGAEVEMIPLTEFIGNRFEKAITEKTLTKNGRKPNYRDDAVYSVSEYLTNGYIAEELNERIIDMIQQAKTQAEQTLIKNLEENLQQQLNADMIQKLNIPSLLESLQNTISIEEEN